MILFYKMRGPYGSFTNFSPHPVTIYGRTWKTSEAAYQARKFSPHRPDLIQLIWEAENPWKAAKLGRERSFPLREDWEQKPSKEILKALPTLCSNDAIHRPNPPEAIFSRVKDIIMYKVCLAKFQQNKEAGEALIKTFPDALIEDSPIDSYWGWGSNKVGQNKLGRILMIIRTNLVAPHD